MKKAQDAKEKIIKATTELIQESRGNAVEITTRAIAERANTGIGLINYHFQTKDNLVEVCVQQIIGEVISHFKPDVSQNVSGKEYLKCIVKMVADFLAENQAVAQISILGDYKAPKILDNTMKTVMGFCLSLKEYDIPNRDKTVLMFTLTSVLQAAFLRRELSGELFGYDFNDKSQRHSLIDFIIDSILKEHDTDYE